MSVPLENDKSPAVDAARSKVRVRVSQDNADKDEQFKHLPADQYAILKVAEDSERQLLTAWAGEMDGPNGQGPSQ